MRIAYRLERAIKPSEDLRADQQIIDFIRKSLKNRNSGKNMEIDLGVIPIPIKDFLFNRLKI